MTSSKLPLLSLLSSLKKLGAWAALTFAIALPGCSFAPRQPQADLGFTLAVVPDSQNMMDYRNQKNEGFAFDAYELFMGQMRFIADHAHSTGGDIAFVVGVGDVWQHHSLPIDPEHQQRGFKYAANPFMDTELAPTSKARSFEIPAARAGYQLLADRVPFGVAPGNHDYDAMWTDSNHPPVTPQQMGQILAKEKKVDFYARPDLVGMLHMGGQENFRSVFGADSSFFKGKDWYVASFRGGADSAQKFSAAGYTFLHIALEVASDQEVLDWADSVIRQHPGLPTIITTHDYLNPEGERKPLQIIDLKRIDSTHNNAEDLWQKFIRQHDQIFLVLCGHQPGAARRVDMNSQGHAVYQILADYQDRKQTFIDAGASLRNNRPVAIGDGWLRLMKFDFSGTQPTLRVRTYSSHYQSYSQDLPNYTAWYKKTEKSGLSDADYLASDDYQIALSDFRTRYGNGLPELK